MCPDGTQCRLGSPDAPDATRYGAWVQDAQDAQDAESESGRNTMVSDADHLFADGGLIFLVMLAPLLLTAYIFQEPAHPIMNST